jgi:hypothetical protein
LEFSVNFFKKNLPTGIICTEKIFPPLCWLGDTSSAAKAEVTNHLHYARGGEGGQREI